MSSTVRPRERLLRRVLATLATAVVLAGCASSTDSSDATLPPLPGAPTTLQLSDLPTSTGVSPSVDPASSTSATTVPHSTTSSAPGMTPSTWGGWAYYEVPQLGTEPVRGSGCGANGGLGEVVPDGVWNVVIGDGSGADRFWANGTIALDMRCIYAGSAGQAQWNVVCGAAPDAPACEAQSPDWFVVNNNSRLRTMPVAPGVLYGVGALGSTPCAGVSLDPTAADAPWRSMDSWVVISGGAVTAVIAACPAG